MFLSKKPKIQNIRIKEFLSLQKNLNMSRELSEQEIVRRESLQKLLDLGINPYPSELFNVTTSSKEIKNKYSDGNELEVSIAGRIMSRRVMGKALLRELQDSEGRIQIYVNRDEVCQGEDKTMYNTVFKETSRYW